MHILEYKKTKYKKNRKLKQVTGFSLLEMMVVLTVFAFLAVISTQAIISTLRVSAKASSQAKLRSEVDYALAIIERHLHNATSVTTCPNDDDTSIVTFVDQEGGQNTFSCMNIGEEGYIASASARITSSAIAVTSCSFTCSIQNESVASLIEVNLSAKESGKTGPESSNVDISTQIYLRTY